MTDHGPLDGVGLEASVLPVEDLCPDDAVKGELEVTDHLAIVMLRDSNRAVELSLGLRLGAIEADLSDAHWERHAIVRERAGDPETEELAGSV